MKKFVYLSPNGNNPYGTILTFADMDDPAKTVTYSYRALNIEPTGLDLYTVTGRVLANGNVMVLIPYYSGFYVGEVNNAELIRWNFFPINGDESPFMRHLASYIDRTGNAWALYNLDGDYHLFGARYADLQEATSAVDVGYYGYMFTDTHLISGREGEILRTPLSSPGAALVLNGDGFYFTDRMDWYGSEAPRYMPCERGTEYVWMDLSTGQVASIDQRWKLNGFCGPYGYVYQDDSYPYTNSYLNMAVFPPAQIACPVTVPSEIHFGKIVYKPRMENLSSPFINGCFVFTGYLGYDERLSYFATSDNGASWIKWGRGFRWENIPIGFVGTKTLREKFFGSNFGTTEHPGYSNDAPMTPAGG